MSKRRQDSWLTSQLSAARKSVSGGPQWLRNAAALDYSASKKHTVVEGSKMADRKVVRDAGTGRYVPKKEAERRPRTTVTETVKRTTTIKKK